MVLPVAFFATPGNGFNTLVRMEFNSMALAVDLADRGVTIKNNNGKMGKMILSIGLYPFSLTRHQIAKNVQ